MMIAAGPPRVSGKSFLIFDILEGYPLQLRNMHPRLLPAVLIIALLALGAYFLLVKSKSEVTNPQATSTTPTTTPVTDEKPAAVSDEMETFSDDSLAVSFQYPDTYTLVETSEGDGGLVRFISLYDKEAWDSFKGTEGSDSPPSITYAAIEANGAPDAKTWAETSPLSNYKLNGSAMGSATIGGASAFRYRHDGLFPAQAAAIKQGDIIHVFAVSYPDPNDSIVTDFETLLKTVKFSS